MARSQYHEWQIPDYVSGNPPDEPRAPTYAFDMRLTSRNKQQILRHHAYEAKHKGKVKAKANATAALADRIMLGFIQEMTSAR